MGLKDTFGGIGSFMVSVLAGEHSPLIYRHKKTSAEVTLQGFYVSHSKLEDPIGKQTGFQNIPRFRIVDCPFPENEVRGDEITDTDGRVWIVERMHTKASGLTTAWVRLK